MSIHGLPSGTSAASDLPPAAVVTVHPYSSQHQEAWDAFIDQSKNGAFLFMRAYMQYHSDRFVDASLLFMVDDELVAVLPANRDGDACVSHGGLTFGGIVCNARMSTALMLEIFAVCLTYLRGLGIKRLLYKPAPVCYQMLPAAEDLYALFRFGARLMRREVGAILHPAEHPRFRKGRRSSIAKAHKAQIVIRETDAYGEFWPMLEHTLLSRHQVKPSHALDEILLLCSRFPQQIRLFAAYGTNGMQAGTVVYENAQVAHTQYIATSDEGRSTGALDLLLSELISKVFLTKRWFSFGISTEAQGTVLNAGLMDHKESFGARASVQDCYEIDLSSPP